MNASFTVVLAVGTCLMLIIPSQFQQPIVSAQIGAVTMAFAGVFCELQ
jgi:hypothetical protein